MTEHIRPNALMRRPAFRVTISTVQAGEKRAKECDLICVERGELDKRAPPVLQEEDGREDVETGESAFRSRKYLTAETRRRRGEPLCQPKAAATRRSGDTYRRSAVGPATA